MNFWGMIVWKTNLSDVRLLLDCFRLFRTNVRPARTFEAITPYGKYVVNVARTVRIRRCDYTHPRAPKQLPELDAILAVADKIAELLSPERRQKFLRLCELAESFVYYWVQGWGEAERFIQEADQHNGRVLREMRELVALERVQKYL